MKVRKDGILERVPIDGGNTTDISIDDGGNSITVDGTFWQTTQPISAVSLPLPSGASTEAKQDSVISLLTTIDSDTGTIAGDTTSIDGKITTCNTGNVTIGSALPAGNNNIGNVDIVTVPSPLNVIGGGTEASALRVTIANDSTGVLTVDGTIAATQSGTWNINNVSGTISLPTGASTSAKQDTIISHVDGIETLLTSIDSDTSTIAGDTTSIDTKTPSLGQSNKLGSVPVTLSSDEDNINVDVISGVQTDALTDAELRASAVPISASSLPLPTGAATSANQLPDGHNVTVDNGSGASAVNIQDGGNSITVDGTVSATQSGTWNIDTVSTLTGITNDVSIEGDTAHDSADSGNPIKIGGKARTSNPTAVSNGDRVDAFFDDTGKQVIITAPRDLIIQQHTSITTSTETTILTAAASTYHDITMLMVTNSSNTPVTVDIRDDTAGTVKMQIAIAPKGGVVLPFNTPFTQTAVNDNWTLQSDTAVSTLEVFVQAIKNV